MPTPGRRALFLGLDGVMHHRNAKVSDFLGRMPLLEQAIGPAEIDLVLLSCWDFAAELERLRTAFPSGLRARVIGRTAEEKGGALHKRFKEIQNWLRAHPAPAWRVLDTDPYDYPDNCAELLRCSPATGMTQPQAEALKLWLQNPKAG